LPVPESAVPSIRPGTSVNVHVAALNRDFIGKVARFADDLNQETRTMHTEVDVPNNNHSIVSGMYAEVTLDLEKKEQALVLPVQAVDRNGAQPSVLVVDPQNRVQERQVRLGLEGANHVEIVSGVLPNERVIIGPRGQFRVGDAVAPRNISEDDEAGF
jgi:RND family efflux transporter MFP subunit